MEDTDDSNDNIPLRIVQRIQGNFERRKVRPAPSCASSKNDDSRTTVVNDSDSEIPDDICHAFDDDYDEDDGSLQSGRRDDHFFNTSPNQDLVLFSKKLFRIYLLHILGK